MCVLWDDELITSTSYRNVDSVQRRRGGMDCTAAKEQSHYLRTTDFPSARTGHVETGGNSKTPAKAERQDDPIQYGS
jgi:hypothetical protein